MGTDALHVAGAGLGPGRWISEPTSSRLGVMLYEMASGQRPFAGGSDGGTRLRDPSGHTAGPDDSAREFPEGLMRVITRCLEKEPGARFPSMRDVHDALQSLSPGRRGPTDRSPESRVTVAGALALAQVAGARSSCWRSVPFGSGFLSRRRRGTGAAAGPEIRSIAVLPLDNYSGDPGQDYFAEGMTDELTADLARISQLRVISRGSAMQFGGSNRPSTPEIAKALDVDAIVEGSVLAIRRQGPDHGAADRCPSRPTPVVQELRAQLARRPRAAGRAGVGHRPGDQRPADPGRAVAVGSAQTVNPEAYDAYLKGRYFFNRPSDENLQKAIARFEDAIALNPNFVPALSGLSDAYLWAGYNEGFITASEARPKAKAAAEKAIGSTTARPKPTPRSPSSSSSTSTTGTAARSSFAEPSSSTRTTPSPTTSSPSGWPSRDGTTNRSPRAGSPRSSTRSIRRSPSTPSSRSPGTATTRRRRSRPRRAADLDPTYFFPDLSIRVDRHPGRQGRGRHPASPAGQDHGSAGLRQRLARLRLRGFR